MNNKTLTIGLSLVLLASLVPATAYHITGNFAPGPPTLRSSDWVLDNSALIICESDGISDPRLPREVANPGLGGLCTTGRNAATIGAANVPADAPNVGDWTQADVCSVLTGATTGSSCTTRGGSIGTIGWGAELGAYECFVPTTGTVLDVTLGVLSPLDFSLYYQELYAWWSYDGTPNTTTGAAAQYSYDPGTEPGYHGHVAMFPDPTERALLGAQVVTGSAHVVNATAGIAAILAAVDDDDSALGDFSNECGASPSNSTDGNQGPVIVAPSGESPPVVNAPLPIAAVTITGGALVGPMVTVSAGLLGWVCDDLFIGIGPTLVTVSTNLINPTLPPPPPTTYTVTCDNQGATVPCLMVTATAASVVPPVPPPVTSEIHTKAMCSGTGSADAVLGGGLLPGLVEVVDIETANLGNDPFTCSVTVGVPEPLVWSGTCTVNP